MDIKGGMKVSSSWENAHKVLKGRPTRTPVGCQMGIWKQACNFHTALGLCSMEGKHGVAGELVGLSMPGHVPKCHLTIISFPPNAFL